MRLTNANRAAIKRALRGRATGLDTMTKDDLLATALRHGLDVHGIIAASDVADLTTPGATVTDVAWTEHATPTTSNLETNPMPPATTTEAARQLASLLERLATPQDTPMIDEGRIIALIQEHAPKPERVEHVVTIQRDGAAITTVAGAHPLMGVLAKCLSARMASGFVPAVLLVGPTASGKTHAAEQVASLMELPFYLHGAMSMSHELLGFTDGMGNYHRTPFRDAYENGGVVLLDELDSWEPAATLALNGGLANGVCAFPDGMVRRHKDCIIVAAGNTYGTGPTAEFVGRNRLDAAFLSRFSVKLAWNRDPQIELAMAGNHPDWAQRVMAARERANNAGLKVLIDPRHTQAGAALLDAGMDSDMVAQITYLAGLTPDQQRTVEGR